MAYKDINKRRANIKNHYNNNKEYYYEKNKKHRISKREWFIEFMKTKQCTLCPETESCTLDWHHLNPDTKILEISKMVNKCYSIETIMEEMSKCICICSNCHRKIHAGVV